MSNISSVPNQNVLLARQTCNLSVYQYNKPDKIFAGLGDLTFRLGALKDFEVSMHIDRKSRCLACQKINVYK